MTDDKYVVRLAGWDDLADISHPILDRDQIRQKISLGEIFLLMDQDRLVGSVWVGFLWDHIPFIDLIFIQPAHQQHGLSHHLLGFVEDHLRAQGYGVLYSSSQMDEPLPQAWHRHMGFIECGAINGMNEGGVGEVFFRKSL